MSLLFSLIIALICTEPASAFISTIRSPLLTYDYKRSCSTPHELRRSGTELRFARWDPPKEGAVPPSSRESDGVGEEDRQYTVKLERSTGIDFGTDLSFRWVYIRGVDPDGSASKSGLVSKGDQLISFNGENCLGAPFNYVMNLFTNCLGDEIELGFYRGTTQELRKLVGDEPMTRPVNVTVQREGLPDTKLVCPPGTNMRDLLIENDINVYRSITRWTNCKGKQLCGTCIVDVVEGMEGCTIKSVDEYSTLRQNPPSYRLSCVTFMYNDVTVKVQTKVGADQWTK